ncbi:MAG TPA: trypsin-like serine protease [Kofleriaceae bacterium]|nr:trypsin-like serine protease [Kofleriaceae bacterium]
MVGGAQAPVGKWNDAAAAMGGGQSICTGTLIAPALVITAGHCINVGIDSVKLGVNDFTSPGGETIAVTRQVAYPNWTSTYDVGLLFLATESSYPPRVLATGCAIERSLHAGATAHIVGYGAIDERGNQYTSELREAATTITDPDCTGGRGCNGSVAPGGELGAGGDGVDACFGDSGGPLYLDDPSGVLLVGVTSRGYRGTELPCSEGGIWVRPDAVVEWIESAAGVTIPRATCGSAPTASADDLELEVESGGIGSTSIEVDDPDDADTHTFATGVAPMHGDVATDEDGGVHYRAREGYLGPDSFTVVVSDSGVPSLTTTVSFTVNVVEDTGGGGCRVAGTGAPGVTVVLLGLALLVPLRRRRRQ